jgi:hypothetical protein
VTKKTGGTKITFRVETATKSPQHSSHEEIQGLSIVGASELNDLASGGSGDGSHISELAATAAPTGLDSVEAERENTHAQQQQRKGKGHSRSRSVGTFIPSLSLNPFLRREEDEAGGGGAKTEGRSFPSLLSPRRIITRDRDKELEREKEKREKELRAFLDHNYTSSHDKKTHIDDVDAVAAHRVFHVPLQQLLQREGGSLPRLATNAISVLRSQGTLYLAPTAQLAGPSLTNYSFTTTRGVVHRRNLSSYKCAVRDR